VKVVNVFALAPAGISLSLNGLDDIPKLTLFSRINPANGISRLNPNRPPTLPRSLSVSVSQ